MILPHGNVPSQRKVQSTLNGEIEASLPIPIIQDTQQPTRPTREGELMVYFQNVNGIKGGTREWEEMVTQMARNRVGIFGFS